MSDSKQRDIGSYVKPVYAFAGTTVDSEVNGAWIDRQGFLSATLALAILPSLADAETLSVLGNFQDADDADGTNAADYGDALAETTILASGTGTDPGVTLADGSAVLKADLRMAKRYIRVQYTVKTSVSGTATHGATVVLGGADQNPTV